MTGDNWYPKCPFYKKEEPVIVRCEGLTKDSRLVLQFNSKKNRLLYQSKYCKTEGYKKCRIYKMLMEKYDEEL